MAPANRRLVVALGGNALQPRHLPLRFDVQQRSAAAAARALAPIISGWDLVLTHGNGPQVGLLALQSEAYTEVASYPLDVLVAESEGMIGYILENELDRVTDREIVTILTRTLVERDDPGFNSPSKPIGPVYSKTAEVEEMAAQRGWSLVVESGGLRRVVPSPEPVAIVQASLIRRLVDMNLVVVCAGGGGIPVIEGADGTLTGTEAVVDKDLASALLAIEIGADRFICLTDVPGVIDAWGTTQARLISRAAPRHLWPRHFAAGSMGPKVEAACRFVEATGNVAAIGDLREAAAVVAGTAGTQVVTGEPDISLVDIL